MNNLIDGITKAYEIAAPFITAKVTIKIMESATKDPTVHYMKPVEPNKATDFRYIPSKWDENQLTELVIMPNSAKTQTIYYRMRDKF